MKFALLLLFTLTLTLQADEVRNFWFNGAEINRYELTQMRYGEAHPGHAKFIFVTEPFLIGKQVKDETGSGPATDVLKLNALRTFNTGIYSYRTMTSTFQPIDLAKFPQALKTNTSIQDWCGQAFQQINKTDEGWRVELRSYFEGMGDQNFDLEEAPLEDAIWIQLRLDPEALPTGDLEMIPGSLFTRFNHRPIQLESAAAERIEGNTLSQYILRYKNIRRELHIEYDTAFPHIIRGWKEVGPSGTTRATLEDRIMNSYYWSENKPADAPLRRQLGLEPVAD